MNMDKGKTINVRRRDFQLELEDTVVWASWNIRELTMQKKFFRILTWNEARYIMAKGKEIYSETVNF